MPNLLRPARWPLNVQNALLAVVILTITTLAAGLVASGQGENALLDHEIVDLNDETNLRAKEFQRQVTRFGIELRRRTAAAGALAAVADGSMLQGLRDHWSPTSELMEATGTRLDSSAIEGPFAHPRAAGEAPPPDLPAAVADWLKACLSKPPAEFHPLGEVGPVDAGPGGKGPCRVYIACPLGGGRLVVAPLNVTNYLLDESRHSPRHLYYLVGGDPRAPVYLFHPDAKAVGRPVAHRPFAGWDEAGARGARPFPAGELYSEENLPALRGGAALNVADPAPEKGAAPRDLYVYANSASGADSPGLLSATKRRVRVPQAAADKMGEVWAKCRAFNAAMSARAAGGLRYGPLQPDSLTEREAEANAAAAESFVQLAHHDPRELRGAAAEAESLLGDWFQKDLATLSRALPGLGYTKYGWLPEVDNAQAIASFTILETGIQDDYRTAPRLIVSASVAEIKQDVWIETFPKLAWWVLVSILAGGAIAVLMTWYVTRPLRHIRHAARLLAEQAKARASGNDGGPHGSSTHLTLGTLPTGGPPEVASLSASLVNMLGEIEHLSDRFRQRNAEFESILKDAPDGIVLLTADGELVRDNAKFKRLFGHGPAARLTGTSIRQYLRGADDAGEAIPIPVGSSFADAQGRGEFWTLRRVLLKGTRADGKEFPADCTFTPIELDGSFQSHYTGIVRDFTERAHEMKRKVEAEVDKQRELKELVAERTQSLKLANESLELANKAKDLFMANVSHELRAPLTVISGDSQMLLRSKPAPEVERRVRRIYDSMSYLTALVNDILDSMKIIEGKLDLNPREFDFPSFVEKVAAEMRPRIEEGKNGFTVYCAPEVGLVCQDDVRLKQVMYNLIGNAAKFTREGSIKVECWRGGGPDGDLVRVAVTDSGRGLTPEELVKVQNPQPFGKLKDRERNREGTGLGLVICKGLCEKMGGALHATSDGLGRGATFTALFAARLDETSGTDSTPPRPVPRPATGPAVENCRILVVDDEPSNRELADARLTELGFQVHVASSDIDAIQKVSHVKPAAILLDIVLRDSVNGWAILKLLKEDPGTRGIPVIIVSVLDEPAKARESGADDYVVKPVRDWDDMAKRIRRLAPGAAVHTPAGGAK